MSLNQREDRLFQGIRVVGSAAHLSQKLGFIVFLTGHQQVFSELGIWNLVPYSFMDACYPAQGIALVSLGSGLD